MKKPINIDEYISSFSPEIQKLLEQVRAAIKDAAPAAEELMSYGVPAFKLNGLLVWFGAYTNHVGFYPRPSAIEVFKKELTSYKSAKGSIQFPFNKPLPVRLIKEIVKFRVKENREKLQIKK